MPGTRPSALTAAVMALLCAANAQAQTTPTLVDVQLVLAVDASRSIDVEEYFLQKDGYVKAISDPAVVAAIRSGPRGAIAVTYVEWSNEYQQSIVVPWQVIRDTASAEAFGRAVAAGERRFMDRTSISGAIDFAARELMASRFDAIRSTIDISGDGSNNSGRPADVARDDAVRAGITINALAILNPPGDADSRNEPPVDDFMRRHVIGGPNAFVVVCDGFATFRNALRDKLVMEIAGDSRLLNDYAALPIGTRAY